MGTENRTLDLAKCRPLVTLTKGFQCRDGVGLKANERREVGILTTP